MRGFAPLSALLAYVGNPDPRVAAANWIAILVALNQPFYPLYVWWIVGDGGWAAALTFLSTPFFFAVPAVSRRLSMAGRAMPSLVGAANTMLVAKAFGPASGVELFLFPCAMAAAMAFRRGERTAMLVTLGAVFVGYLALHDRMGAPLHVLTADAYGRFVDLNIFGAAGLILLIALQFSAVDEPALLHNRPETANPPPSSQPRKSP